MPFLKYERCILVPDGSKAKTCQEVSQIPCESLDVSSIDYSIEDMVPVLPHHETVGFFGGRVVKEIDESKLDVAVCALIERNIKKVYLAELDLVVSQPFQDPPCIPIFRQTPHHQRSSPIFQPTSLQSTAHVRRKPRRRWLNPSPPPYIPQKPRGLNSCSSVPLDLRVSDLGSCRSAQRPRPI